MNQQIQTAAGLVVQSKIRNPKSKIVGRSLAALMVLLVAAIPASAQISISGVTPDSAWGVAPEVAEGGLIEFTITGSFPFPATMSARLFRSGQPDIVGTDVTWVDPVTVTATMSMIDAAVGKWDVEVTHATLGSASLVDALKVKPAPRIRRLTSWGGPTQAMEVVGNLGYVARGSGLVVLDVTDPNNLIELGSIDLGGVVYDLDVAGNYAFVVGVNHVLLTVVDVSDPSDPSIVVQGLSPGSTTSLTDIVVQNGVGYVMQRSNDTTTADVFVLDVSVPTSPAFTGGLPAGSNTNVLGVAAGGDHLYTVHQVGSDLELQVLDIAANPLAPTLVGVGSLFGIITEPLDMAVDGGAAFVVGTWNGVSSGNGRLIIFDVSDPANPAVSGTFFDLKAPEGVCAAAGTVYVADQERENVAVQRTPGAGLVMIDVSNPALPVHLGTYESRGAVKEVALSGSIAFALDYGEGVIAVNVAAPANPVALGKWRSPGFPLRMDKEGDHLFFNDFWSGMTVLDVSDPRDPTVTAFIENGPFTGENGAVQVQNGLAYGAAGFNGVRILDVSMPSSPSLVGTFGSSPAPGVLERFNGALAVNGDVLVARYLLQGNVVLDVSDPANPLFAAALGGSQEEAWAISDDLFAYSANRCCGGGSVFDLSNPHAPVWVSPSPLSSDVDLEGTRLVQATNEGSPLTRGVRIYDVLPTGDLLPVASVIGEATNPKSAVIQNERVYMDGPFILPNEGISVAASLAVMDVSDLEPGGNPTLISVANLAASSIDALLVDEPYVYGSGDQTAWDGRRGPGLVTYLVAVPGDADNDFDNDLADYAALQRCFGGSGVEPADAICLVFDFDEDDDIDADDLAPFTAQMVGPN